jgi:hypothetical protein
MGQAQQITVKDLAGTHKSLVSINYKNKGSKMASKGPPKKVWKQTTRFITLEPIELVLIEIEEFTSWSKELIMEKLCCQKMLIRLPEARYHIYRDCLG